MRGKYARTEAHNKAIREGLKRHYAEKNGKLPRTLAKTETLAICPYCKHKARKRRKKMKALKIGEKVKIRGLIYKLVKTPPNRYYWLKRVHIRRIK